MDNGQMTRYSKDEIELFKKIFSHPDTGILLRNHFLQLEVSKEDETFLKTLTADEVKLLGKFMVPDLAADVPLKQEANSYQHLSQFAQLTPDLLYLHIQANDIVVEYLHQQLALLTSSEVARIFLSDLCKEEGVDQQELRVKNMIAYNMIIPIVEGRLSLIETLITKTETTPEEVAVKTAADSAK